MKMLLNIIIVGMFSVEICSPFMIGYLNKHEKQVKASNDYFNKRNQPKQVVAENHSTQTTTGWKSVDYTNNAYSDSKALKIKE